MPHGWAIAELWLLMRDCLLFEDDNDRIVLLAGIPPEWFLHPEGMEVKGLKTYFGSCDFAWKVEDNAAALRLSGTASPPNGFVLRLPSSLNATVMLNGERVLDAPDGHFILPGDTKEVLITFERRYHE